MIFQLRIASPIRAFLAFFLLADAARAGLVTEYFNGYGATTIPLDGGIGGSGNGWAAGWLDASPPPRPAANYSAGTQLLYNQPGYQNTGNLSGPNNGDAGKSATAGLDASSRQLSAGLGGDVWFSALMETGPGGSAAIWLGTDGSNGVEVDFLTDQVFYYYNGVSTLLFDFSGNPSFRSQTHLVLYHLELDALATNDRFSVWFDPLDVPNVRSGAELPLMTSQTDDVSGSELNLITLRFQGNAGATSQIDSIRTANGPGAFDAVMTGVVPEPSSFLLLGAPTALAIGYHWRRRVRARGWANHRSKTTSVPMPDSV